MSSQNEGYHFSTPGMIFVSYSFLRGFGCRVLAISSAGIFDSSITLVTSSFWSLCNKKSDAVAIFHQLRARGSMWMFRQGQHYFWLKYATRSTMPRSTFYAISTYHHM